MSTLTPAQRAALRALQRAHASAVAVNGPDGTGGVLRSGWGHSLATLRALDRLGLVEVVEQDAPRTATPRNARTTPPPAWVAVLTEEGVAHRV